MGYVLRLPVFGKLKKVKATVLYALFCFSAKSKIVGLKRKHKPNTYISNIFTAFSKNIQLLLRPLYCYLYW